MTLEKDTLYGVLNENITRDLIQTALQEDMDLEPNVTLLSTVPTSAQARARLVARQGGVIMAIDAAEWMLQEIISGELIVEKHVKGGTLVRPGTVLTTISVPTRGLLTAERTVLNILTYAGGVVTVTRQWADTTIGTGAQVRDSRKTLPGLRNLGKYMVTYGDGINHHYALGDEALIRDSHVMAVGSVSGTLKRARAQYLELPCETKVGTLAQPDEILPMKPDIVVPNNFEVWEAQIAVQHRSQISPATQSESSGGLTIDVTREFASCGVDYLTVGALTRSAKVFDVGLDFDKQ